ncbi:MAG: hypothetical protein IKW89_01890 [Bacteroidales bacterium]|nr:hypothetical protein [Bacteroidales bacterium]
MKSDHLFRALRTFLVFLVGALVMACGENNPDEPGPGPGPDPEPPVPVPETVVALAEDTTVKVTETEPSDKEDHVAFIIEGEEEKIKDILAGTVLVLDEQIVLVTSVKKMSAKSMTVEGPIGDLRYVFHDTSFTLHLTGTENDHTDETSGDYYPVSTKVAYDAVLWSEEKEWDFSDTWMNKETEDQKQSLDYNLHTVVGSSLSAAIDFEFTEEVNDIFDGISFARAKEFNVTVTFTGEVHSSADLTINYKIDQDLHFLLSHYKDPTILLKHDFFKPKIFIFFIGKVPVVVHIGCDLYAEIDLSAHGEMTYTMGAEASLTGMLGYKYDGNTGEKKKVNPGLVPHVERHDPTFKGKGVISPKLYVWPHEYIWFSYLVGCYADIRPYGRADFGVAFSEDLIEDSTSDYLTNTTDVFVGADWSVGISTPLDVLAPGISYELDWTELDSGHLFETQVVRSPAGLVLEDSSSSVYEAGNSYDLSFKVLADYYGTLAGSAFIPIVKIDIPSRTYNTYRMAQPLTGIAKYTWTPEERGEELIASVYDLDGNVVGRLQFQAGVGETTLYVITGAAQSVSFDSATIPVEYKCPGDPVSVGVVYSSTNINPEVDKEGCLVQRSDPYATKVDIPLTGLQENTFYCVRAFIDMDGNLYYGDVVTFTTSLSSYGVDDVPGENY